MNDYIVTRLRGSWDCSCLYIKENGLDRKCLHCEAADEIERLRAQLQLAHSEIAKMNTANDEEEPF